MGLGLRSAHYADVLSARPRVAQWFEVVSENYMADGGRPLHILEKIRADYPLALHGVSLSIGSVDELDSRYLKKLRGLIERFEPAIVSDHLCWTGVDGENLHDLLPLPYTEEAAAHVATRVERVQERLGRRILLENVSSYLTYEHAEMQEWEFLSEIARRTDCGLLIDLNNIYVSAVNHGFSVDEFLGGLPAGNIGQFHLAGHSTHTTSDGRTYLVDTHDHPICDEVWALYVKAIQRFGQVSTMIEWDANIPSFERLEKELEQAGKLSRLATPPQAALATIRRSTRPDIEAAPKP